MFSIYTTVSLENLQGHGGYSLCWSLSLKCFQFVGCVRQAGSYTRNWNQLLLIRAVTVTLTIWSEGVTDIACTTHSMLNGEGIQKRFMDPENLYFSK